MLELKVYYIYISGVLGNVLIKKLIFENGYSLWGFVMTRAISIPKGF